MAWRWLRHQPDSALARWFEKRTAGGDARARRVMITALARKLLIALWRLAETGPRADRRPARLRSRPSRPPPDAAGAGPGGA